MICLRALAPFLIITLGAPVFAAGTTRAAEGGPQVRPIQASEPTQPVSLVSSHLDPTCSPCEDFYRFSNGGWITRHPVPEDRSHWSAYAEVEARTRETLRETLRDMARTWESAAEGSGERKLGLFFACCMDTARIEREGIAPLRELLAEVDAIDDARAIASTLGRLHRIGVDVPFSLGATTDPNHASMMMAELWQSGLTLPVADWYLEEGQAYEALRADYAALVERAFQLVGRDQAEAHGAAAQVLAMETLLADASMAPVDLRDPRLTTNRQTRDQLRELLPSLDWDSYYAALGFPEPDEYNVGQPRFLSALQPLLAGSRFDAWHSYLSWWLIRRASRFLGGELATLDFRLRGLWSGATAPPPRIRMCEGLADFALGETLGRVWAEKTFPPEAKRRAEHMVDYLRAVLRERIEKLDWMTRATRREAIAKIDSLDVRIGYSEEPFDHSALELDPSASLLRMVATVSSFRKARDLSRIGKPDPGRWALNPQRVTGAYIPGRNSIEYPAGKFQLPFFGSHRDEAMNYGAIGATIAHEITHALDDEGRQYDADGNLRDWWTAEDEARFEAAAARLVEQFDGYTVLDSIPVNGRLTLGENIADLGGITIAYHAYLRSLGGEVPEPIDGFTAEQRFFLSWAQNFRETIRPDRLKTNVASDVHAPSQWRVNGSLSNLPEFARAFDCRRGDPMVRPDSLQARIW